MLFPTLFLCLSWASGAAGEAPHRRPQAKPPALRRAFRPCLERLEDRALPSSYTAATVSDLIADINAANAAGGTNTITLTAPTTSPYVLTAVDNSTDGPTGLAVISGGGKKVAADNLTIVGNGDTIERSTASGTPDFRLFDVASGASLTLENLTLQNGLAFGSGSSAEGGAIYNQGNLILSAVTVQNNLAQGSPGSSGCPFHECKLKPIPGGPAAGGGIWSGSSLTLENGTLVHNNQAIGGTGAMDGQFFTGSAGGDAFGGGLYISGGTANLTGVTVNNNSALGGFGPFYGKAFGGGIYVAAGSVTLSNDSAAGNAASATESNGLLVPLAAGGGIYIASEATATLCNDTVQSNSASNPGTGVVGQAVGGGIYIESGATVYLDMFTVANTINNTDNSGTNGSTANIDGTGILRNC
jgi:hypothetical protein